MSCKIGELRCIVSYQFLGCSLEKLVENLHGDSEDNNYDNLIAMQREYPEYYKMLCRKGYSHYEWVDGPDKMDYHGLPPMDAFYSKLPQKKNHS